MGGIAAAAKQVCMGNSCLYVHIGMGILSQKMRITVTQRAPARVSIGLGSPPASVVMTFEPMSFQKVQTYALGSAMDIIVYFIFRVRPDSTPIYI